MINVYSRDSHRRTVLEEEADHEVRKEGALHLVSLADDEGCLAG